MYLQLLYQMHTIDIKSNGNALAQNRCNSLPSTVRTSKLRWCNQNICCLKGLGSRSYGPAKWSCHRLISSVVPWVISLSNKLFCLLSWFLSLSLLKRHGSMGCCGTWARYLTILQHTIADNQLCLEVLTVLGNELHLFEARPQINVEYLK